MIETPSTIDSRSKLGGVVPTPEIDTPTGDTLSEVLAGQATRHYASVYGGEADPERLFEGLPWTPVASTFGPVSSCAINVTSAMAELFLMRRDKNRRIEPDNVLYFARMMAGGWYKFTGQPLIFTPDGKMLDGQHRSGASSVTGRSFSTLLVRGISSTAFDAMDAGMGRELKTNLAVYGRSTPQARAALIRRLLNLEEGIISDRRRTSAPEALDAEMRYGALIDEAIAIGSRWYNERLALNSSAATAYVLAATVDREAAIAFFEAVVSGAYSGDEYHPTATLRRWLQRRYVDDRHRTPLGLVLPGVESAWNAWRRGRTLSKIVIGRSSGQSRRIDFK